MAVTTTLRLGTTGGAMDTSLMLKVFAGETIKAFQENNLFLPMTRIKNVSGGAISWTFPVFGTTNAAYHTPGENILTDAPAAGAYLKTIKTSQRIIHMDKALISSVFIDKLDEKLIHYDVRSGYAKELGAALARQVDVNISRMLFNIANSATTLYGGATISGSDYGADGGGTFGSTKTAIGAFASVTPEVLVNAFFDQKIAFDRKGCPRDGRVAVLDPAVMKRLLFTAAGAVAGTAVANGPIWVDRDYSGLPNSNGSFREGKVPMLAGFYLLESNNLDFNPSVATYGVYDRSSGSFGGTGAAAGDDDNLFDDGDGGALSTAQMNNDYSVAYTATNQYYALLFNQQAMGTVKLEDLSVQTEFLIEYQGDVLVARMVLGHGILRPECTGCIAHT